MANVVPQNVTVVDDRNGNHFWIFTIHHVTGADSDVQVEHSCISASELTSDGTRGANVVVSTDDTTTDAVKELTFPSASATGDYLLVARFGGSAGSGSGHEDL